MPTDGDALVTPKTVSTEALRELFESASMETSLDSRMTSWYMRDLGSGSFLTRMVAISG